MLPLPSPPSPRPWRHPTATSPPSGVAARAAGGTAHLPGREPRLARGNFYFVETPQAIPDLLTSELGDSLEIVAREAALVLHVPDGVDVAPLGPFPVASAARVVRIELGGLASGQELQLVVRLTFPAGMTGDAQVVSFALVDKGNALGAQSQDVAWAFVGHAENDAQRRDRTVDRAVARLYAAIARQAALALN